MHFIFNFLAGGGGQIAIYLGLRTYQINMVYWFKASIVTDVCGWMVNFRLTLMYMEHPV